MQFRSPVKGRNPMKPDHGDSVTSVQHFSKNNQQDLTSSSQIKKNLEHFSFHAWPLRKVLQGGDVKESLSWSILSFELKPILSSNAN